MEPPRHQDTKKRILGLPFLVSLCLGGEFPFSVVCGALRDIMLSAFVALLVGHEPPIPCP
jgi:hypothetical protein